MESHSASAQIDETLPENLNHLIDGDPPYSPPDGVCHPFSRTKTADASRIFSVRLLGM